MWGLQNLSLLHWVQHTQGHREPTPEGISAMFRMPKGMSAALHQGSEPGCPLCLPEKVARRRGRRRQRAADSGEWAEGRERRWGAIEVSSVFHALQWGEGCFILGTMKCSGLACSNGVCKSGKAVRVKLPECQHARGGQRRRRNWRNTACKWSHLAGCLSQSALSRILRRPPLGIVHCMASTDGLHARNGAELASFGFPDSGSGKLHIGRSP